MYNMIFHPFGISVQKILSGIHLTIDMDDILKVIYNEAALINRLSETSSWTNGFECITINKYTNRDMTLLHHID